MMERIADYHIGEYIHEVVRSKNISIVDFSKNIGVSRNVAYDIFKRESINTDLLLRISIFLKEDFFSYLSIWHNTFINNT